MRIHLADLKTHACCNYAMELFCVQVMDGHYYGWIIFQYTRMCKCKTEGEAFLGGYLLRSLNRGKDWDGPFYPPSIPGEVRCNPMGGSFPAYIGELYTRVKTDVFFWVVLGK